MSDDRVLIAAAVLFSLGAFVMAAVGLLAAVCARRGVTE